MSGMGLRKSAHNSQLPFRFSLKPRRIDSVRERSSGSSMTYNWLVITNVIATISNCWNILRASISTCDSKESFGTQGNDLERNNIEDCTISSQASKLHVSMKKVQRLDDIGLFKCNLKYSPILRRKSKPVWDSRIRTDRGLFCESCSSFFKKPKKNKIYLHVIQRNITYFVA